MGDSADADLLLDEVLPLAQRYLGATGCIVPFAAAIETDGVMVHLQAGDVRCDPTDEDIIERLIAHLRAGANAGLYRTTAVVCDVTAWEGGRQRDAVLVSLDQRDGLPADMLYPYVLAEERVCLSAALRRDGETAIFKR